MHSHHVVSCQQVWTGGLRTTLRTSARSTFSLRPLFLQRVFLDRMATIRPSMSSLFHLLHTRTFFLRGSLCPIPVASSLVLFRIKCLPRFASRARQIACGFLVARVDCVWMWMQDKHVRPRPETRLPTRVGRCSSETDNRWSLFSRGRIRTDAKVGTNKLGQAQDYHGSTNREEHA